MPERGTVVLALGQGVELRTAVRAAAEVRVVTRCLMVRVLTRAAPTAGAERHVARDGLVRCDDLNTEFTILNAKLTIFNAKFIISNANIDRSGA